MRIIKFALQTGMNAREGFNLKLKYMEYQDHILCGWFLEQGDENSTYEVYVALTGEEVPDEYRYVCTTQTTFSGGYYVLHAYD